MKIIFAICCFVLTPVLTYAQWSKSHITEHTPFGYNLAALNINGNVSFIVEKYYSSEKGKLKDQPWMVVNYYFDEKGRVSTSEYKYKNRIKYSFTYDNAGRPVEIVLSGDSSTVDRYEYNNIGGVLTKVFLHKTGWKETFESNSKGQLAKWVINYRAYDGITWRYRYEYNPDGTLKEIRGDDGEDEDWELKYDNFKYDSKRNVISLRGTEWSYGPLDSDITYTYEYDSKSNWTSRTENVVFPDDANLKDKNLITREYKYK